MEDHDHPELDWDPLDDTKIWPEDKFPLRHAGVTTYPTHPPPLAKHRKRAPARPRRSGRTAAKAGPTYPTDLDSR